MSNAHTNLAIKPGTRRHQTALRLFPKQHGCCGICHEPLSMELDLYSIDHIVPIANGGSNFERNMQVVHVLCNQNKRGKEGGNREHERGQKKLARQRRWKENRRKAKYQ